MTSQILIATGAVFGMLSVIFGAFGAHALKKILTTDQLHSFEVGVKYQMYHAIVLLAIGYGQGPMTAAIYGLILSDAKGKKLKFLGPITPIGGLLLVTGWLLLIVNIF